MIDVTAREILAVLRRHHDPRAWLYVEEVRCGTGYDIDARWVRAPNHRHVRNSTWERRIDAFAMCLYPSRNFERIAYEVKVSRSDFLHEISQPEKRTMAMSLSNLFYFAVPEGLVSPDEVPDECGLIVAKPMQNGVMVRHVAKKAARRVVPEPPLRFMVSLARRMRETRI